MNATDRTDAMTDEATDRPFVTPSFIINCWAFVFLNRPTALIVIYFCLFTLFVADD